MAWTNRKNIPVTRGQSKGTAGHAPAGHRPDRKVSLAMGALQTKWSRNLEALQAARK